MEGDNRRLNGDDGDGGVGGRGLMVCCRCGSCGDGGCMESGVEVWWSRNDGGMDTSWSISLGMDGWHGSSTRCR